MVEVGSYPMFNLNSGLKHLQLIVFIVNLVSVVDVPERKPVQLSNDVWMQLIIVSYL